MAYPAVPIVSRELLMRVGRDIEYAWPAANAFGGHRRASDDVAFDGIELAVRWIATASSSSSSWILVHAMDLERLSSAVVAAAKKLMRRTRVSSIDRDFDIWAGRVRRPPQICALATHFAALDDAGGGRPWLSRSFRR